MGETEKGANYLICDRELSFKSILRLSFLVWYEQNMEVSTSNEICTKLFNGLDIREDDERVDNLNDDEKIEILNIIGESNGFTSMPINSCDDFVSGLNDYCYSYRKEFSKSIIPIARGIQDTLSNFAHAINDITKDINLSIPIEILTRLKKAIEALPVGIKEMHEKLMIQGWYMPLSILLELEPSYAYKIINSEISDINEEMLLFAQEIENSLLSDVKKSFNNRYDFVSESMKYHNEEKYKISIPIMLIQADGITLDIFKNHLFTRQKQRKESIEIDDNVFMDLLGLYPLKIDSAISVTERIRSQKDYYRFNRHEILHGEDLNYGIRENSYRCIMLLKYLIDLNNILRITNKN